MFIQIIQGRIRDADHLQRQLEGWRSTIKPGATGYLGSTGGIAPDGRCITVVRFDSEEAARANSERPEQGVWWNETSTAFDGEITFHDCREVDTAFGGGSNHAGFVQIIQGRAKDQEAMRRLGPQMEQELHERRPDILGITMGWHGDGGFTQVVYFTSAEDARRNEAASENDELGQQFMALFDGEPTFFDLPTPDLD